MSGFFTAPQVAWGPGAIEQLSGLGARRALLVVDPSIARHGAPRRIVEELEKSDTAVEETAEVTIEPTLASVERLREVARAHRPDWIVAVGGGSTIDTAKGLWVRHARPDVPLEAVTPLAELGVRSVARFVAIPSTSGSGSEASWSAHLRRDDGRLLELGCRELMPDWALLDAGLADTLPPTVRAETAGDLLAHALESIASEWTNAFSDALARHAIGVVVAAMPRLVRSPPDPEGREAVHAAATLAGLAAANSQLGAAHALAHALAGVGGVPHARLAATLLPYVVEYNYPAARDRYMALAPVVGAAAVQNRSALTERLRSLWDAVGLPKTLPGAGVAAEVLRSDRAAIIERTRASPSLVGNPRLPSAEELGRLLDAATDGRPVDF
jgi:alcohol dehydrogenase class IV